jgi:hypothetical protein
MIKFTMAEIRMHFDGLYYNEAVSFIPNNPYGTTDLFIPPNPDLDKSCITVSQKGPISGCLDSVSEETNTIGFIQVRVPIKDSTFQDVHSLYYYKTPYGTLMRVYMNNWVYSSPNESKQKVLSGFEYFVSLLIAPYFDPDTLDPLQVVYYQSFNLELWIAKPISSDKFVFEPSKLIVDEHSLLPRFPIRLTSTDKLTSVEWYLIAMGRPLIELSDKFFNMKVVFLQLSGTHTVIEHIIDLEAEIRSWTGGNLRYLDLITADMHNVDADSISEDRVIMLTGMYDKTDTDLRYAVFACLVTLDTRDTIAQSCCAVYEVGIDTVKTGSVRFQQIGFYDTSPYNNRSSGFISTSENGTIKLAKVNFEIVYDKEKECKMIQSRMGEFKADPLFTMLSNNSITIQSVPHLIYPSRRISIDNEFYAHQTISSANQSTFVYSEKIDALFATSSKVVPIDTSKCWSIYSLGQIRLNADLIKSASSQPRRTSLVERIEYINTTNFHRSYIIVEFTLLPTILTYTEYLPQVTEILGYYSKVRDNAATWINGPLHTISSDDLYIPKLQRIIYYEYLGESNRVEIDNELIVGNLDLMFDVKSLLLYKCRVSSIHRANNTLQVLCYRYRNYFNLVPDAGILYLDRVVTFSISNGRMAIIYNRVVEQTHRTVDQYIMMVLDKRTDYFFIQSSQRFDKDYFIGSPKIAIGEDFVYFTYIADEKLSLLYAPNKGAFFFNTGILGIRCKNFDLRLNSSGNSKDQIHLTLLSQNQIIEISVAKGHPKSDKVFYLPRDTATSPTSICRLDNHSVILNKESIYLIGNHNEVYLVYRWQRNLNRTVYFSKVWSLICVNSRVTMVQVDYCEDGRYKSGLFEISDQNSILENRNRYQTIFALDVNYAGLDSAFSSDGGEVFLIDSNSKKSQIVRLNLNKNSMYLIPKFESVDGILKPVPSVDRELKMINLIEDSFKRLSIQVSWIYPTADINDKPDQSIKLTTNVTYGDNLNTWSFKHQLLDKFKGHFWKLSQSTGDFKVTNRFMRTIPSVRKMFINSELLPLKYLPIFACNNWTEIHGTSKKLYLTKINDEQVMKTFDFSTANFTIDEIVSVMPVPFMPTYDIPVIVVAKVSLVIEKFQRLALINLSFCTNKSKDSNVSAIFIEELITKDDVGFKVIWRDSIPTIAFLRPRNGWQLLVLSTACPSKIILLKELVNFFELVFVETTLSHNVFLIYSSQADSDNKVVLVSVDPYGTRCLLNSQDFSDMTIPVSQRFFSAVRCINTGTTLQPEIDCVFAGKQVYLFKIDIRRSSVIFPERYKTYKNFDPEQIEILRGPNRNGFIIFGRRLIEFDINDQNHSPFDTSGIVYYSANYEEEGTYIRGSLTNEDLLKSGIENFMTIWPVNDSFISIQSGGTVVRYTVEEPSIEARGLTLEQASKEIDCVVLTSNLYKVTILLAGVNDDGKKLELVLKILSIVVVAAIVIMIAFIVRKRRQSERDRVIGKYSQFAFVNGIGETMTSNAPDTFPAK